VGHNLRGVASLLVADLSVGRIYSHANKIENSSCSSSFQAFHAMPDPSFECLFFEVDSEVKLDMGRGNLIDVTISSIVNTIGRDSSVLAHCQRQ